MTEVIIPEPVPKVLGMMVHCDGSCDPNPGFAGSGIHGYIYEDVEPTKGTGNPDYVLTAKDYVTKTDKALTPDEHKIVTPIKYIDGYISYAGNTNTNNFAELSAATAVLQLALEQGVSSLNMWSDSRYVTEGSEKHMPKWKLKGWKKPDGNVPASVELWQEFDRHLTELRAKGVKVRISWCEGHTEGNFGNEMADAMAYIGSRHAVVGEVKKVILLSEPQGYWKYETNRHPFFNHRRMYFNSDSAYTSTGEYYFGEEGKEDDQRGKRSPDSAFSVVRLANPDHQLEMVRSHVSNMAEDRNAIIVLRMDYMFRSDIHAALSKYATIPLRRRDYKLLDLVLADRTEPLVTEMTPEHIIQRTVNEIGNLGRILNEFMEGTDDLTVTDITPLIYETIVETKKSGDVSINKLRTNFIVGTNEMTVPTNFRRPEGELDVVNIKLTLGLDMLDRNSLKRLEATNPSITLVTYRDGDASIRYATIVKSGEDIGIWAAPHSNLRIILPKAV